MHRSKLLQLLGGYATRYPAERDTTERFRRFVRANRRCFERELAVGHVTASAWLVNGAGSHVLLTHHRKLGRWLQLGGHSDGDPDSLAVAVKEAEEESGLSVVPLSAEIFDLDVHEIPARKAEPAHLHFDVRFALQVTRSEAYAVGPESVALAWVDVRGLREYTSEPSMLRMRDKWLEQTLVGQAGQGGGLPG